MGSETIRNQSLHGETAASVLLFYEDNLQKQNTKIIKTSKGDI